MSVTLTGRACQPIYPVIPPSAGVATDVGVSQLSISQTNFESAPAVIRADVRAVGFAGQAHCRRRHDNETGKNVERQQMLATADGKPLSFRFQFRPEHKGVNFYQVRAFAATDDKKPEPAARNRGTDRRADARQQQPAGCHRPGGWALPGALRERASELGVQVPAPQHSRRTTRSNSPGWSGSPGASPNSTFAVSGPRPTSPLFEGLIIPTRKRPNGLTSRS